MQVNIGQSVALGLFGIFEADVVKVDRAVLDLGDGVFRAGQVALLGQHFDDTLGRFHRHGDHDENHRQAHQAHQNLEAVGQDGGHLADSNLGALAADDQVRTKGEHERHAGVDADLHHRAVQRHDALGLGEVAADILGSSREFLLLIIFADIALDNAHGLDVFLNRVVERVVFAEYPAEDRHGRADNQRQTDTQQRNGDQKDHGQTAAHHKAHHKREDQHQRAADCDADDHHEGHLHVDDVGGHTGDQAGYREFVDVLKRIVLNVVEHILAQVARKTGGCGGAGVAGRDAENQRQHRHDDQDDAVVDDDTHLTSGLHLVDQIGDDKRNDTFQNDLDRNQQRRLDGRLFELADTAS